MISCLHETHSTQKDTERVKRQKIYYCNTKGKEAGVAIFIPDKADSDPEKLPEIKRGITLS